MIRTIVAEVKKLKRTLALQMVVIAPLLVLFLSIVLVLRRSEPVNGEVNPWSALSGSANGLWNLMMVPLVITLQTALTGFTEHSSNMWKYLYTLPVGRWQFFCSKFVINSLLILIAQICFVIFLLLSGFAVFFVKADLQFSSAIPWGEVLLPAMFSFVTSLLIVAIHTWVSLRFRSIVISLGTGIGAVVASMLVVSSEYGQFFPWSIPGFIAMMTVGRASVPGIEDNMAFAINYLFWMVPVALVVVVIGSLEFSRVDA